MSLKIPKELLLATRMAQEEISRELALHLYEERKLSFGKAKELAGMTTWEFQQFLGSRKIPLHYDLEDYQEDIKTLRRLKRV